MFMNYLYILLLILIYSDPVFAAKLQYAYACENTTLQIKCAQGVINVIRENYGRLSTGVCYSELTANINCVSKNTTDIIRNECANKQSCSVLALDSVFGDPCPGTHKYLEVEYKCISTLPPPKYISTCEGSNMHITCESGYMIDLLRVNYGRLSKTVCNSNGWLPIHNLNCVSRNSYDIVDEKCSNEQTCILQASSNSFGDPCANTLKYLEVKYQCIRRLKPILVVPVPVPVEPATKHKVACESSNLSINCEAGYKITVLNANYGRLSRTVCNPNGRAPIRHNYCSSDRSKNVVSNFCFGKQICNIPAINIVFGDPCEGTSKYLEVNYICT